MRYKHINLLIKLNLKMANRNELSHLKPNKFANAIYSYIGRVVYKLKQQQEIATLHSIFILFTHSFISFFSFLCLCMRPPPPLPAHRHICVHHITSVLYGNKIKNLPTNVFRGLTSLQLLLLNANEISCIRKDTFKDLNSLSLLSLYDNNIQSLANGTFDAMKSIQTL